MLAQTKDYARVPFLSIDIEKYENIYPEKIELSIRLSDCIAETHNVVCIQSKSNPKNAQSGLYGFVCIQHYEFLVKLI